MGNKNSVETETCKAEDANVSNAPEKSNKPEEVGNGLNDDSKVDSTEATNETKQKQRDIPKKDQKTPQSNDTTKEAVNNKPQSDDTTKQPVNNGENLNTDEVDLEHWMTNLPRFLRLQPFIHLAIPGTHNSMTYLLSSGCGLAPDAEPGILRWKFLGRILRYIVARWSKNQIHTLEEQLAFGVRYLDFRVTTKPGSPHFYFAHGLYCGKVPQALQTINDFLTKHPKEALIVDFQHFYAFSTDDHKKLVGMLLETFSGKLVPYLDHMHDLNLEYMCENGHQVLVVYRSCYCSLGNMLLWPSKSYPTPWHNTVEIEELISSLEEGLTERNRRLGFVSQCVLTPDADFVQGHLFSTFKKQCVLPFSDTIHQWVDGKLGKNVELSHGTNVIIADYVGINDNRFARAVVKLNTKKYDNFVHLK